jgi:hypothetical protein
MQGKVELGFNDGLEAAAKFLEGTADDYCQMAAQEERGMGHYTGTVFASIKRKADDFRDKAQLLRGQAGRIRSLS